MEQWEINTSRYVERIGNLADVLDDTLTTVGRLRITQWGDDHIPPVRTHLLIQLALFVSGSAQTIDQLVDHTGRLWADGRMVGVSPLVRLVFEYWGAIVFANDIAMKLLQDGGDIDAVTERCVRLTSGSRSPVRLPWGDMTTARAYSVMEFVRRLADDQPDALQRYDFLCEASHPSFFQHFYFVMASKRYDNWSNEVFAAHAHELLEKTVSSLELAIAGVRAEAAAFVDAVLPVLDEWRNEAPPE
jgi:hypothetical protein